MDKSSRIQIPASNQPYIPPRLTLSPISAPHTKRTNGKFERTSKHLQKSGLSVPWRKKANADHVCDRKPLRNAMVLAKTSHTRQMKPNKLCCLKRKKLLISDSKKSSELSENPSVETSSSTVDVGLREGRSISEVLKACEGLEPSTQNFIRKMLETIQQDVEDETSRELLLEYFSTLILPHVTDLKPDRPRSIWDHQFHGLTTELKFKLDFKFPLGFKLDKDEEMFKIYQLQAKSWSFDIFGLDVVLGGKTLVAMINMVLEELNLFAALRLDRNRILMYSALLHANYPPNPYHNQLHGADVTHAIGRLLKTERLTKMFTNLEKFALVMAAAAHDVGHPGVNSQFLINTSHPLAITYNDISVLENYHCASMFALMECKDSNFLQDFSVEERKLFRRIVIQLILATDLARHASLVEQFKTVVEEIVSNDLKPTQSHKETIYCCVLHCADLSGATKELHIYREWTNRVMQECFQQGEKEANLNLAISPMCDRNSVIIEAAQTGFIDLFVEPLWKYLCILVEPEFDAVLTQLFSNRKWYASQLETSRLATVEVQRRMAR